MEKRIIAGKSCLSLKDEEKLYALKDSDLESQMRTLLPILSMAILYQMAELQESLRLFNSLCWIYIQRPGVLGRVTENIYLLWVLQGIKSINQFAKKLAMNPSFTGRVLSGESIGLGGWNLANLMKISGVLKVKPEALLFSDLGKTLEEAAGVDNEPK